LGYEIMKKTLYLVVVFTYFLLCKPVFAVEISLGMSSLGPVIEVGHKVSNRFNARVAIGGLNVDFGEDNSQEEPDIESLFLDQLGEWQVEHFSALIDYHPWQGNFRLTAGINNNKIIWTVESSDQDNYRFNGQLFNSLEVESTELTAQFTKGISPYVGIGWSTGFDNERGWSFNGDFGAFYLTDTEISFDAKCADKATQCDWVQAEAKDKQADLQEEFLGLFPIFGLGLSYKF